MKRFWAVAAAVTLAVTFAVGCGAKNSATEGTGSAKQAEETAAEKTTPAGGGAGDDQAADSKEGDRDRFVGFSVQMMNNEFFINLSASMKEKIEAQGWKFEVASADGNVARQIEQLENFVSMGADTLVIMPVEATAIADKCEQFRKQGVEVIAMGSDFGGRVDSYDIMLGTDQYSVGEQCARNAADWIEATFPDAADGSVEVAVLACLDGQENIDRGEGIRKVEEFTKKAKIVEQYQLAMDAPPTKAQEYMDIMAVEHPDVKVLLCHFQTYGLYADENLMMNPGVDKEHTGIFTCDWNNELGRRLKLSETNESLIRASSCYGSDLSGVVVDALLGKFELNEKKQHFDPVYTVTPDNADTYITEETAK